ncbi:MAG: DNA-3-methyladenine glycosylase [Candidatus Korobacteraceae bacterium]|jgi:3-methyladenine DNA glycosylase/8-oxoguanine DNA glycosylase
MQPKLLDEATEHLKRTDRRMAQLIERVGPCTLKLRHEHSIFYSLLRSIVYQQLAGKAAAAILGRVDALFPGALATPEQIVAATEEELRSAGLSRNKMLALKDLAAKTLDGTVPQGGAIDEMSDEEIIERVSQVRGIGRWTVEMLLIFRLGRTDVLPLDDFGVRKGFQRTYRLPDMPTKQQMLKKGEKWKPWRSIASWYLWRAAGEQPALKKKAAAAKGSKVVKAKRSKVAKAKRSRPAKAKSSKPSKARSSRPAKT